MEDESLPVGFTLVRVLRSPTSVHVAEPVHICTTFSAAPLRLVPKELPPATFSQRVARVLAPAPTPVTTPIRAKCDNPPHPSEALHEWRVRKAEYESIRSRRLQRVDWYLNSVRAARV